MEEVIKAALMQWGEAMQLGMENRSLFYSPVLKHWRVKKWAGKEAKSLLYDGGDFRAAFEAFLGTHAADTVLPATDPARGGPNSTP
jgi:hypothetical protein